MLIIKLAAPFPGISSRLESKMILVGLYSLSLTVLFSFYSYGSKGDIRYAYVRLYSHPGKRIDIVKLRGKHFLLHLNSSYKL